ncbi:MULTISPECIES: hypothetical protein [Barnesiella]|nr:MULTISPECIES: hypothetical protein [Barnesiella]
MIRVINYFRSIAIELMAVRDILGYRRKISYVCISNSMMEWL